MLVNSLQLKNAKSSMVSNLLSSAKVTLAKLLHPLNALSPMVSTEAGIFMLVKPLHPLNASIPMISTELGMLMLVKPLHSLNASGPISVRRVALLRSRFTLAVELSCKAVLIADKSFNSPVTTRVWGPSPVSPAITEDTLLAVTSVPSTHLA